MRWSRWTTVAAVALLAVAGAAVAALRPTPEPTVPRYLTDDQGRALILHGLNTSGSAKDTPDALPELTESDVERESVDMGTNFVRYLIQWRAVEPRPGEYDDGYLAAVAERIGWYRDRGYHVMLDMHQDLYGRATRPEGDTGNGAPAWATDTGGLSVTPQDQWELIYLEPGVMHAFDAFWGTTATDQDLTARYAAAWRHIAGYFADEPAVLGYDLMNEPWGGSLQGAAFETGPLARLYQDCVDAIRQVDTGSWIFVEPQAVGVNWGLPSALPALDDPSDRIGYAPHLYPLPMDLGGEYVGDTRDDIDAALDAWLDNILTAADRLDAPVVLGEFGLDATAPGALDFVTAVADLADRTGMGWSYWSNDPGSWGPYAEDGSAQPLVGALQRAYPLAVAGVPTGIEYDRAAVSLTVSFDSVAGVTAPTELYLPPSFGDGGTLDCPGGCDSTWDADRRVLSVTTDPAVERHSVVVTAK